MLTYDPCYHFNGSKRACWYLSFDLLLHVRLHYQASAVRLVGVNVILDRYDNSDLINLLAELCVLMLISSLTLTSIDIRSAS